MARGRVIDREFYSHEGLAELPIEARYLYQGLIIWADDEGRMKAAPKYLKAKIFPYDNVKESTILEYVNHLATIGCILVYQVATERYLQHKKWDRWQNIRKDRFRPSDCPPPVDGQPTDNQLTTKCQPDGNHTDNQMATTLATGGIPILNLTRPNLTKESSEMSPSHEPPPRPIFMTFPTNGKVKEWALSFERLEELKALYPGVTVELECRRARDWAIREPRKRKTALGMERFLNSWLSRQQNLTPQKTAPEEKRGVVV